MKSSKLKKILSFLFWVILIALLILLFPLDFLRRRKKYHLPLKRIDERDTMFARANRKPGTPQYEEFYGRRYSRRIPDDRLRSMPELCKPGGKYYHPSISKLADEYFEKIYDIKIDESTVNFWAEKIKGSSNKTGTIKKAARQLGAVAIGCTELDEIYVYSHKGRLDENYGEKITGSLPSAIVFLVEMDYTMMQSAPRAETIFESAKQYYRAATISLTLVEILKRVGHDAKAHYDAHYDLVLPPLAEMAGLGEVGRNNILVADKYGSRVRIGAVTTDFPLNYDSAIHLGVDHFCEICKKCSENCPPKALDNYEKSNVNGVFKWSTEMENCYSYWRFLGTDCGICMAVCPFSHKNNLFHNSVRFFIRFNPWLRHIALWFDEKLYGREWNNFKN